MRTRLVSSCRTRMLIGHSADCSKLKPALDCSIATQSDCKSVWIASTLVLYRIGRESDSLRQSRLLRYGDHRLQVRRHSCGTLERCAADFQQAFDRKLSLDPTAFRIVVADRDLPLESNQPQTNNDFVWPEFHSLQLVRRIPSHPRLPRWRGHSQQLHPKNFFVWLTLIILQS